MPFLLDQQEFFNPLCFCCETAMFVKGQLNYNYPRKPVPSWRQEMHEKALVLILRCSGIVLLTAIFPALMPFRWMQAIHSWMGMGDLPNGPIVGYLTRSLSLLYALHGALILYVSGNIIRYLPIVKCLAILGISFGVLLIFIDIAVDMPVYWILSEGPFLIPLSMVILWLTFRIREPE